MEQWSRRSLLLRRSLLIRAGFAACLLLVGCRTDSDSTKASTTNTNTRSDGNPDPDVSNRLQVRTAAEDSPIWKLLQQNPSGCVVMMRHAEAPGTGDPANFQLGNCSTQRNLSVEGRAQAEQIGQAFRDRRIPITRVLSSQWCRCLDTARLLGLGQVEPFPALNSFFQDSRTEPEQTAAVRELIISHRQAAGVLVLVTHQVNITAISGVVPRSGESIVLRANDGNQIETIGQLPLE